MNQANFNERWGLWGDELRSSPQKRAISDREIYQKLQGRTNILMYNQLKDINQIEQIFKDNSCVILYEQKPKSGHWVCLLKHGSTIEFFDSYGLFPDDEKHHIDPSFLLSSNQQTNHLVKLLLDAQKRGYRIEYNNYHFQNKNASTCGRHVIARILMKNYNIEQYNKFIKSFKKEGLSPDDVVTIITSIL